MNDRSKITLYSGGHKGAEAEFGNHAELWKIQEVNSETVVVANDVSANRVPCGGNVGVEKNSLEAPVGDDA